MISIVQKSVIYSSYQEKGKNHAFGQQTVVEKVLQAICVVCAREKNSREQHCELYNYIINFAFTVEIRFLQKSPINQYFALTD